MSDSKVISCCSIEFLWQLRSLMLVKELGLLHRTDVNFTVPLLRYILASCMAIPVKTIVLVERPYRTNIHPYAASAMSYDPLKNSSPTPSTAAIATDMKNKLNTDWNEIEAWFRDSWMFIKSGVFLINVCCFEEFMGNSLNERVAIERFVRDMIVTSYNMSGITVELVALGNPAISSCNRIRSSIADRKSKLKVHRGDNPAGVRHRFGDLTSPSITIGSNELTKALHRAVIRSRNGKICTQDEYDNMTTVKQANMKNKLISAHRDFDEDMEHVAQFFRSGGKYEGPVSDEQVFVSLRKSTSRFMEVLIEERVLLMLTGMKENDNAAKGAYSSGHREYQPKSYRVGSSSEVSGASKSKPTPVPQKARWIEEDDVAPTTPATPKINPTVPSSTSNNPTIVTPDVRNVDDKNSTPLPSTPSPLRPHGSGPRSVSGQSTTSVSRSAQKLKFIEEESDSDTPQLSLENEKPDLDLVAEIDNVQMPTRAIHRPSSPVTMSEQECNDMGIVGEFLHASSGQYGVSPSIVEEVNEAAANGRASSDVSKKVLEVIKQTKLSDDSTIEMDLGFVSGQVRIDSPIMRTLLTWAS